jgi:hypothetical protein
LPGDGSCRQIDQIGAGDGLGVFGIQAGIEDERAGQQLQLVGSASIEPFALDLDRTLADVQAPEAAVSAELRLAGGECGAAGVDEAAAIDADAVGVGNDQIGALARDFDGALMMSRALLLPSIGLPPTPPASVLALALPLLLRIWPSALTLYWVNLLCDMPAPLGRTICTMGTPLLLTLMMGRDVAAGSATKAAADQAGKGSTCSEMSVQASRRRAGPGQPVDGGVNSWVNMAPPDWVYGLNSTVTDAANTGDEAGKVSGCLRVCPRLRS